MTSGEAPSRQKTFYEAIDREQLYGHMADPVGHPFNRLLRDFIDRWNLRDQKCLEIGSGKGIFQDVVADYTGADIASTLARNYHKPFVPVTDARLPFDDASFDAIFTYATHEHIPDIEIALAEIVRVLKPGGVCLFAPAWHTRPWFAEGYGVRPFSELALRAQVIKLSVPFRDNPIVRYPFVFVRRLVRLLRHLAVGGRPGPLKYRKLQANYGTYWQSDSDACNSLDPFDVIVWFSSRGLVCHGYGNLVKSLFVRTYALEIQKPHV